MRFKDAQKSAIEQFDSPEFKKRIVEEDSTMMKQLPLLKEINKLGYLTIESQAGRHSVGKSYSISERAYMAGFMEQETAAKFIKYISINTDKNAAYVPVCGNYDLVPSKLDIPVTVSVDTKSGLQNIETHLSPVIPLEIDKLQRKQVKLNLTDKSVFIVCWDIKWNRLASGQSGLFTDIIKALNALR